jgi:hypothetical protein
MMLLRPTGIWPSRQAKLEIEGETPLDTNPSSPATSVEAAPGSSSVQG